MKRSKIEKLEGRFLAGDCETVLRRFPDDSIDLVLTSPPYEDKRDYGTEGSSVIADEYVAWFLPKARQIYRVLKPTGSFVLNISDTSLNSMVKLLPFNSKGSIQSLPTDVLRAASPKKTLRDD